MKQIVLLILFLGSFAGAQTIPDEMAIAKAKFNKEAEALATATPEELNGKYVAGLEVLKEKRTAAGDLEGVLAITKEIESIKSTGNTGDGKAEEDSGLPGMRDIYVVARRKWHNARIDTLEKMKRDYLAVLDKLVTDFTKAGKIDEALVVRAELKTVPPMILKDFGGVEKPTPVALAGGEKRAGQLRGFGRLATTGENPDWEDFDLKVLEKYDDFVEVEGSPYELLFRRESGEVYNQKGKKVGDNAAKLIVSASLSGYVDVDGEYHVVTDIGPEEEIRNIRSIKKYFNRRIALKENGDVVAWGGVYKEGRRVLPPEVQKGVKQVAAFYDQEFALREDGNLYRWDNNGLVDHSERTQTNIERISVHAYTGYALSRDNDLYYLNGSMPPFWTEKAKNVICRGEFVAILDMKDKWHVFAHQKTPMGNELEVLKVVMNRPETIDVELYLYFSARNNNNTASYAVWIEEPGTPELDVKDVGSLPAPPATPRRPGTGFFGVEID